MTSAGEPPSIPPRAASWDDVAVQVLDRRLGEGDLTIEEHAQRRQALHEHGHRSRSRSGRWSEPVAAIAAATLVVMLLVWLGMTSGSGGGWMDGHMAWRGSTSSTTQVVDGAREIDVEARELSFTPATIQLTAGEPVNLRLINTGEAFHDLTVPTADVVLSAEAGEQASGAAEFAVAGRYEFYCSVPGHAQGGMRGTIVVTDAS